MKKLILPALLLCACMATAQKAVLLHKTNGTQQAFYSNAALQDAYNAAGDGDTIYLPGGYFSISFVDKRLKIFGAGHYPDSTLATEKTIITNSLNISENADSLLVEGLDIYGDVGISQIAVYVKIKRCRFNNITVSGPNAQIEGNVISGTFSGGGPINLLVVSNIIQGSITNCGNGTVFRNNIFLADWRVLAYPHSYYVVFENNIFTGTNTDWNYGSGSTFNTFTKNIFYITPDWGSNTASGNYTGQANVFVSQAGATFNYAHNYHLQNPGSFPGVDGTQCGIYGGLFIYREGAVPINPHIIQKNISATTDGSGKLNATIKVAAQNN